MNINYTTNQAFYFNEPSGEAENDLIASDHPHHQKKDLSRSASSLSSLSGLSGSAASAQEMENFFRKRFEPQQPRIMRFQKFKPSLTAQPRRSALKNTTANAAAGQQPNNATTQRNKLKSVLFKAQPYRSLFNHLSTVYEEGDDLLVWTAAAHGGFSPVTSQFFISPVASPNKQQLLSLSSVMKSSRVDFADNGKSQVMTNAASNGNKNSSGSKPSSTQTPTTSRPVAAAAAFLNSSNNHLPNMANQSYMNSNVNHAITSQPKIGFSSPLN